MKVNEIEINGKIYRANYIKNSNICDICESCDLKANCNDDSEDNIIFELCQRNPFKWCFKEVTFEKFIGYSFYKFSTGTVFNVSHIKHIVDMGYVELCIEDPTKYGFTILMANSVVIFVRFDTKTIATRERNKFIKFIEKYGYANNSK